MSYINDNLIDGENIVYTTRKHWGMFLWPVLFMLLFFIAGFNRGIIGLVVVWLVLSIINFLTSEFGITNKRIIIKTGVIKRLTLETFLDKIEGVSVNQNILGRVLGYGTIVFSGVGGTKNTFHKISNPLEFARKVRESIAVPLSK